MLQQIKPEDLARLSEGAWTVREHARVIGKTSVGCAALAADGTVWLGCNVEHRFRSHDVHAEVNAISSMVAGGKQNLSAVLIAAARDRFTPCGACLDWIFEFGGAECAVAVQGEQGGPIEVLTAGALMPHYPR